MNDAVSPCFGERRPGIDYIRRPGAYGVIRDGQGRIGIVEVHGVYHLPGGGIDAGEDPRAALEREVREETGWTVEILRSLGTAIDYYDKSDGSKHLEKVDSFFTARRTGEHVERVEGTHHPLWVTPEQFRAKALFPGHVWALEQALHES